MVCTMVWCTMMYVGTMVYVCTMPMADLGLILRLLLSFLVPFYFPFWSKPARPNCSFFLSTGKELLQNSVTSCVPVTFVAKKKGTGKSNVHPRCTRK